MNGAVESGRSAGADVTPRASHACSGASLPFARIGSTSSHAIECRQAAWVASPSSTPAGGAAACSLAATFTASPITVSSRRPSGPTGAKMTSPVLIPALTQSPPKSAASSSARRWISRAARTARSASSSWAIGAPNTAISASPMTLSTMPPNRSTTSPISFMQPSTIERISSGSVRSESEVNPDRSANRTVTQRRSPSSLSPTVGG